MPQKRPTTKPNGIYKKYPQIPNNRKKLEDIRDKRRISYNKFAVLLSATSTSGKQCFLKYVNLGDQPLGNMGDIRKTSTTEAKRARRRVEDKMLQFSDEGPFGSTDHTLPLDPYKVLKEIHRPGPNLVDIWRNQSIYDRPLRKEENAKPFFCSQSGVSGRLKCLRCMYKRTQMISTLSHLRDVLTEEYRRVFKILGKFHLSKHISAVRLAHSVIILYGVSTNFVLFPPLGCRMPYFLRVKPFRNLHLPCDTIRLGAKTGSPSASYAVTKPLHGSKLSLGTLGIGVLDSGAKLGFLSTLNLGSWI